MATTLPVDEPGVIEETLGDHLLHQRIPPDGAPARRFQDLCQGQPLLFELAGELPLGPKSRRSSVQGNDGQKEKDRSQEVARRKWARHGCLTAAIVTLDA